MAKALVTALQLARHVVFNPLVLSTVLGTAWAITGTPRPTLVDNSLTIFGDALAPSALFAIGLGLSFEDVRVNFRPSMLLVVIKLVVLLALVWGSPCYSASITTSQLRRWCAPPRLSQRPPISWRASTTARGRSSPRQYR